MTNRAQGEVITARTMRDTLPRTEITAMSGEHSMMVIIRIDRPIIRTGSHTIRRDLPTIRIDRTIRKDHPTTRITGIPVRKVMVETAKAA